MSGPLTIRDLTFTLRESDRRASIGITIERDGTLVLTAPKGCPSERVLRAAESRLSWIYGKLAERETLLPQAPEKEYVTGESFAYLGRSYRLQLIDPAPGLPPLRLHQGRFVLRRDERPSAREHFTRWYITQGHPWLERRVARYTDRIGAVPRKISVRDLGYRWGSCTHGGRLLFHWRALLLPPRIIDYLVVHELVHLRHPRHDDVFWQHVARVLPDSAARKEWLARHGGAL